MADFARRVLGWIAGLVSFFIVVTAWSFLIGEAGKQALSGPVLWRATVPFMVATLLVMLSWRWKWIGTAVFAVAAALFAGWGIASRLEGHPAVSWTVQRMDVFMAVVALLIGTAFLFLWSRPPRGE